MQYQFFTNTKTVLPAIIFLMAVLLNGCIQHFNNYGVVGMPMSDAGNKRVTVIVAENSATTNQENGGYRKTTYSTSYWLKQYETATGKLLKKKKLLGHTDNPDISCYGIFDNKIWLYVNGIEAYDINSLEKLTDEQKIATENGVKKTLFPYGSRLVNPGVENGYIDFTADNGESYRLNLEDLKIKNKAELKEGNENAAEKIKQQLQMLRGDDEYGTRCDTFSNKFFAFAKNSAAAANSSISNSDISEVNYRMYLFTADYSTRRLGNHNSFDYSNIQQNGATSYLNPCFLKDVVSNNVIHASNPAGYLIFHQDVVGSDAKSIVTRIDVKHNKIWENPTGISTKIANCIVKGKYCFLTGNTSYMLSPHIGKDALCIIDIQTGAIIQALLSL